MATFRLSHFASPEILASVQRPRLFTFLDPFRDFLRSREFTLPPVEGRDAIDFTQLSQIFLAPDQDTPAELIDSLYYIDRLAQPQGMLDVLAAARTHGLDLALEDDVTPADVAVQLCLQSRPLLIRLEAEQHLDQPRSFEYYLTDDPPPFAPAAVPDAARDALEEELNDWFDEHKRGRSARVTVCRREEVAYFLIRHGEPFKREESVVGRETASVAYRPLRHDVAAYDPVLGELRINAQLKGERELYRTAIGRCVFGRDDYFPWRSKYTLQPIRRLGEGCLVCADVAGLEAVKLRELHYAWGGKHDEYLIERAADLFAAMRDRGNRSVLAIPRLTRAVFAVWYPKAKRPRSVTITVPNSARYTRDAESAGLEQWLRARGFLQGDADADDPAVDAVLVGP